MGVIKIMKKNNLNENFRNRTVCRVEHILNRAGNEVKNQFLITTNDGEFFQSYKSIIEFKNHYVVMPSIIFFKKKNYKINSLKEKGKLVTNQFEYSSKENKLHLTKLIDIKNFLKKNDNSLFKTIDK